jgi:hypothetical protein
MRKIEYILFGFCLLIGFGSCSDFFDNDLKNVEKIDGRKVQQDRDAFYQLNGILQLMQDIGTSYVVMGELRGDLVSQTENSSQDLRDIEFFEVDSTNAYLNERKLYALVNNCNYFISVLDSSSLGQKTDTLTAQAKCIRAWAYLQLALDYGKVHYFTQPILTNDENGVSLVDLTTNDSELNDGANTDFQSLLDLLIADLLPYLPADGVHEKLPFPSGQYSSINSFSTNYLFVPIRYMLGELYMWNENFYEAAHMYYQLMLDRGLTVPLSYRNRWRNNLCEDVSIRNWDSQFSAIYSNNQLWVIPLNSESANTRTNLADLFNSEYQLGASYRCRELFTQQQYTINLTVVPVSGDLRGEGITTDYGSYVLRQPDATKDEHWAYVTKYNKFVANSCNYIILARASQIYLRYAEAVNRLGLHRLAMAVLKYGLNSTTLANTNYMGLEDLTIYPFTDFGQVNRNLESVFSNNGPLHSRGCGDADMNASYSIKGNNGTDSLLDVENKIMDEYVLENAFEGERFHDLMRISQYRRSTNYLATTVALKLSQLDNTPRNYQDWVTFLSNRNNWYLPSRRR